MCGWALYFKDSETKGFCCQNWRCKLFFRKGNKWIKRKDDEE